MLIHGKKTLIPSNLLFFNFHIQYASSSTQTAQIYLPNWKTSFEMYLHLTIFQDVVIVRLQFCKESASLYWTLYPSTNSKYLICIVKQIIYCYARNTWSCNTYFKITPMSWFFQNIIVPVQQQTKQIFWFEEHPDMHFNAPEYSLSSAIINWEPVLKEIKNSFERLPLA